VAVDNSQCQRIEIVDNIVSMSSHIHKIFQLSEMRYDMEMRFWLNYDFGIDGDYEALYQWLDTNEAVECGDGSASFLLKVNEKLPSADVLKYIKKDVKLRKRDRLYLIWRKDNGKMTGEFIHGTRRRSPWAGYAAGSTETEDEP
jgi:hypothetical protein